MGETAETLDRLKQVLARGPGSHSTDFDLNPASAPTGAALRGAAVLIPLVERQGSVQTILTRRSQFLPSHAGQVSFPGGKVDPGDASPEHAALREAHEEIGLAPGDVRVLGQLAAHQTVTSFDVTPFVGLVRSDFVATPDAREVHEVFEVPFAFLMNLENFQVHGRVWNGHLRKYYVLPYGPHYIWGATARILRALAENMAVR
jgi:8-oxo-dGTP pyrophosphatase MutT (NUDIX family)